MGPSINNVGNSEVGAGRGQKLVKIANMWEGVVKNQEKFPTSFMDGPYCENVVSSKILLPNCEGRTAGGL